ncbi:MAG: molybdopterin molybdotransferase MoeA [Gemmatimonadota bacterium]|nr:molybdopterin molybdotransferase MoeA [Gemmatimonadota bacterium]
MIEMDDAIRIVMENTRPIDKIRVGLDDVLGRVLSEDVRSDIDMPPFDKALMDGYALQGADIASASNNTPIILDVIEEIPAGTVPQKRVECGQAAQIMTGAPVPDGADTVIMIEDTEPHTDAKKVRVLDTTETGRNIARLGEDVRVNQVVLQANTVIRPPEVGILAAVGHVHVETYRQPIVGIVATGSEVVEPHHKPKPGQIRNSNGYSMMAQVLRSGAQARYFGIVEDDIHALIQTIGEGLETCDIVALSGGVSAGEYDLVQDGMRDLGVEVLFDRIRMKPGKPLTFGVKGARQVFGLPGNPVSSVVGLELLMRPAIRKMQCMTDLHLPTVRTVLSADFRQTPGRKQFVPAHSVQGKNGIWESTWVGHHGSADLFSMARANSLFVVNAEDAHVPAGTELDLILLNSW